VKEKQAFTSHTKLNHQLYKLLQEETNRPNAYQPKLSKTETCQLWSGSHRIGDEMAENGMNWAKPHTLLP